MKQHKSYTDIIRYGKGCTNGVIQDGDDISITEKLDGANASFIKDEENRMGITCYSRNLPLDENNRLRGYYDWVKDNMIPLLDEVNPDYRYYGEWLCSHKVVYKDEYYHKFYMFSIWDEKKQRYVSDAIVTSEAKRLGIETTPYFYQGKYISFEHLMSFVGKSDMTLIPDTGEGIVVKNINYLDAHGRQMFVKLVSERFAELQVQKLPKNPNVNIALIDLIKSVLTAARVEKILYKLVDEGLIEEDFDLQDMGKVLRAIGTRVYDDIMKEESDLFIEYEEAMIKKYVGKNTPNVVKSILKERTEVQVA